MQVSLDGRVVLVTGAAQGIGRSGAAGIMLTDRSEYAGTQRLLIGDGHPQGTGVGFVEADLLDRDAPLHIAEARLARFGRVDGLVNSAGV